MRTTSIGVWPAPPAGPGVGDALDPSSWSCPVPLRSHERIGVGHGGGGRLSKELIEHLFVPAFGGSAELHDAAAIDVPSGRLAFSTDSYVVRPLFFPGGSIADLAINGTVNDVSMRGAVPRFLSVGFILEEGIPLALVGAVAEAMAAAARAAGVSVVTGDTKVVGVGQADGMYINTAGVGVIPDGVDIRPGRATSGDVVVISGPIGMHGVAVMSQREGLEFGTEIRSDSAPLNGLVEAMIGTGADLHVLRDLTRGGLAAALCEIAEVAEVGVEYQEADVPVPGEVAAACAFLGMDAVNIANEGKLVAFVPPGDVDSVLAAMHRHPQGVDARVIGRVTEEHPGVVVAKTPYGASRVVDLPLGEQLPRIC